MKALQKIIAFYFLKAYAYLPSHRIEVYFEKGTERNWIFGKGTLHIPTSQIRHMTPTSNEDRGEISKTKRSKCYILKIG